MCVLLVVFIVLCQSIRSNFLMISFEREMNWVMFLV